MTEGTATLPPLRLEVVDEAWSSFGAKRGCLLADSPLFSSTITTRHSVTDMSKQVDLSESCTGNITS